MPGNKKEGSKRTLVRWSDDLDKQLLLSIQYACNEAGLRVPWDNVAKFMGEKFSDGAIVQHLSKLRQKMIENNLPVPPPLKRGTTVVPSKIYATSGTSRRKSMPDTPTGASNAITTPKPKQSASKKRTRRSGLDSDSDSQPDDMDIADTSDEEYGASGRKKKKQQRQAKSKQAAMKKATQEPKEDEDKVVEPVNEDAAVKSQAVEEETTKESIETPGPSSRTRGVRPDYSKLEQISDEEEDASVDNVKNNDVDPQDEVGEEDDDQALVEEETENLKIKADGEVSPRSKVPASPATPTHLMSLPPYHNTPHSGSSASMHTPYYGTGAQYQSPQNTFPGIPASSFMPRSNMTSFSTNRNDSASSLSSSMQPAYSHQGSFSHATTGPMSLSSHSDYYGRTGLEFMGGGLDLDMRHTASILGPHEDDHDEFGRLFNPSRQA